MTIVDFKDWLKTKIKCPNWSAGGLRDNKENTIVIYNGSAFVNPMAIGGLKNSSYKGKGIRILVHWDKNINESEKKALRIYKTLHGLTNIKIGRKKVIQFNMRDPEPIYLGVDDSGICEYVIDLEIIHER